MPGTILIIDDEEPLRKLLGRIISLEGFKIEQAGTLREAMAVLTRKQIDIILCDVKLPDGNGVEFVSEAKEKFPFAEIILLTAFGNIPDGVQAIKRGAFDYITKGNDNDRIIPLLYQAMQRVNTHKQAAVKINGKGSLQFKDILGSSATITEPIRLAKKIAASGTTVLLLGETGTGKEVFANAIHHASPRAGNPFIAINCSAFTKDLLESELFGHKAGAYTGATKDKKGLMELADKGTIFLDEIGEMDLALQAKLLRVLENGEFIKLGDVKTTKVDVRIIAATHRNLAAMIKDGSFREDLYYRLNVFTIHLPALRERPDDIPALANYFIQSYNAKEQKPLQELSATALERLKQHPWKGNIRELRNVIERATILADGVMILPEHLPFELQEQDSNLTLASVEKEHIRKVMQYAKGNKTKAAEHLGIGLTTLYRKLEEYQIMPF